jgi:hypothetical protein
MIIWVKCFPLKSTHVKLFNLLALSFHLLQTQASRVIEPYRRIYCTQRNQRYDKILLRMQDFCNL